MDVECLPRFPGCVTAQCSPVEHDLWRERADAIAERARKIGATSLRSVGDVARHQRLNDNDSESVAALVMLSELCSDNLRLASFMRETHGICDQVGDLATASLLENWIDEAERRAWFLTATTATDA